MGKAAFMSINLEPLAKDSVSSGIGIIPVPVAGRHVQVAGIPLGAMVDGMPAGVKPAGMEVGKARSREINTKLYPSSRRTSTHSLAVALMKLQHIERRRTVKPL